MNMNAMRIFGFPIFIQYYPSDIPQDYLNGLDLYLWILSIILLLIAAVAFFIQVKTEKEQTSARVMKTSMGMFCVLMSINKIAFILSYKTAYYSELLAVGYITAILSLLSLVYYFEKMIVKRTHYFFSIVCGGIAILASFVFIFPEQLETIRDTIIILGFLPMGIVVFVWLWALKLSAGKLRKKAIGTFLGIILLEIGYMLDSEAIIKTGLLPDIVAPLLFILGGLIGIWFLMQKKL
jgi:hypothetical protein